MEASWSERGADTLQTLAMSWSAWMSAMSWQVLVVVLVVATITALGRRWPARFRYSLWLLVLVKLILPPSLAAPTGFGWWLRDATTNSSELVVAEDRAATESGHARDFSGVDARSPEVAVERAVQVTPATGASRRASSFSSSTNWQVLLFVAWLAVVLGRVGLLIHGAWQVRKWVALARPVSSSRVLALMASAQGKVGWHGSVPLRNSESCVTPLVVGLWRPTILLPHSVLERLEDAELESVIAHELIHLRRRDPWTRMASALARTVYFFHPAVWWLGRELDRLREDACDESTVAALKGRRHAYGSALVKTAELLGYDAPHLALTAMDRRFPVKRRLMRVLDPDLPWIPAGRSARLWRGAAWMLMALVLLPAGAPRVSRWSVRGASAAFEPSSTSRVGTTSGGKMNQAAMSLVETPGDVSPIGETRSDSSMPEAGDALREPANEQPIQEPSEASTPAEAPGLANSQKNPIEKVVTEAELSRVSAGLGDPSARAAMIASLVDEGASVQHLVREVAVRTADPNVRRAAYEVLAAVATVESLNWLERRYLEESAGEQTAAKRALDAVWTRIRQSSPTQRTRRDSSRFFESDAVESDAF